MPEPHLHATLPSSQLAVPEQSGPFDTQPAAAPITPDTPPSSTWGAVTLTFLSDDLK